jgi:hypothetical protein
MNESFNPYQSPVSTTMPLPGGYQVNLSAAALSGAAKGLRLVFLGVLIELLTSLAGAVCGGFLGVMLASRNLGRGQFESLMHSAGLVALYVASVGLLLRAAGRLGCLGAARETGTSGANQISAGILLAAVAVHILRGIGLHFPGDEMVSSGAVLVAMLLFLVFVRELAGRLGRHDLAGRARIISILCWVCLALWLPTMGLMWKTQHFGGDGKRIVHPEDPMRMVMALLMVGLGLLILVTMILYIILIARVRTAALHCEPAQTE